MVTVEDYHAGTSGSNPLRHIGIFFAFKIQDTCTLTTFVEQNFMRMYVNRERAV